MDDIDHDSQRVADELHALVREMLQDNASELDAFMNRNLSYSDIDASINNCIAVLPQRVKDSVMLEISKENFSA